MRTAHNRYPSSLPTSTLHALQHSLSFTDHTLKGQTYAHFPKHLTSKAHFNTRSYSSFSAISCSTLSAVRVASIPAGAPQ